jgi:hypothetical protein
MSSNGNTVKFKVSIPHKVKTSVPVKQIKQVVRTLSEKKAK